MRGDSESTTTGGVLMYIDRRIKYEIKAVEKCDGNWWLIIISIENGNYRSTSKDRQRQIRAIYCCWCTQKIFSFILSFKCQTFRIIFEPSSVNTIILRNLAIHRSLRG